MPAGADTAAARRQEIRREEIVRLLVPEKPREGAPGARRAAETRPVDAGPLAATLAAAGPVFAAFGRYLGSRIDLLPRRVCLQLGAIADTAPALSSDAVASIIRDELRDIPSTLFHTFDPVPIETRLLYQVHRAWISSWEPVVVRILRPEVNARLETDLPLLPLVVERLGETLGEKLGKKLGSGPALLAAVQDFTGVLYTRLNLQNERESLEALAADAGNLQLLAPAAPRPALCSRSILTLDDPGGISLAVLLAEPDSAMRADALRRLATFWMRQAITGTVLPCDLDPGDIRVLPDQIAVIGGSFDRQTREAGDDVLRYLAATASDDPELAADFVVRESPREPRSRPAEDDLRRRLRQAVPFRDADWDGEDRLAQHLFSHWRLARGAGFTPSPTLLHLYRGAWTIAGWTDRSPDDDLFAEGFRDARLIATIERAGATGAPDDLRARLDMLTVNMMALPRRLDQILTLAAEGRLKINLRVPEVEARQRARNSGAAFAAVATALAAVLLIVRRLAPGAGAGLETAAALVVALAGAMLLWAIVRSE